MSALFMSMKKRSITPISVAAMPARSEPRRSTHLDQRIAGDQFIALEVLRQHPVFKARRLL
jgi:hypothetical protein